MGCISVALSKDEKYFLTRNTTCLDNEEEIRNASLDELKERMDVCKEFYNKFKDEFDDKVNQASTFEN